MLESLDWVGDGDEVDAIRSVEAEFGVTLNYADAPNWFTAGDVFSSLTTALGNESGDRDETWVRFARVLSEETGVDPARIAPETTLLGGGTPIFEAIGDGLKRLFRRVR